jgi:hypothetical protein
MKSFSEKELIVLANRNGWYGNGSIDNPIIIDSKKNFPESFSLSNSSLSIIFQNISFKRVIIKNSHDIVFRDTIFNYLVIRNCEKIEIF